MPVKLILILATNQYDIHIYSARTGLYVSYSVAFSCTVWWLTVMHKAPIMIRPNVKCNWTHGLDLWVGLKSLVTCFNAEQTYSRIIAPIGLELLR